MNSDLGRFTSAQEGVYAEALQEIRNGQKQGHWMWFIFPQLRGLGFSYYANLYGISGLEEAKDYLADETLGSRLREICQALLDLPDHNPHRIFGTPDDMKLCSSMTLFDLADGHENNLFRLVLDTFYDGQKDMRTLEMLNEEANGDHN